MDGYGEHYGAGRVKLTGLSLAHTPPSVYDGQKKEDLKRSRVYVPVDKVIPMDRVNEGVNPVHALRTPQVMPATKRCSTHTGTQRSLDKAAVSNRKQQYEDNRDRRNNLGMDRVDRPLWSASATSARAMELSVEWKRVCNSTSSVFASSTISSPSIAEILLCVSAVIKIQMDRDVCVPVEAREQFPYFLQYPSSTSNATADVPSLEAINVFLHDMFVAGGFSPECNIIALVYINRVISSTGLPIHQYNWCGIVCAAYLLAQKVWDDSSLNTASFAKLFPIFTLDQVSVKSPLVVVRYFSLLCFAWLLTFFANFQGAPI